MAVIRKVNSQKIHFQVVTKTTTKNGYPNDRFGIKKLQELDFYKNQIEEIPFFVGAIDKLEQICLSYNNISVIPDTIRNLKHLKYCYIHHNNLFLFQNGLTCQTQLKDLASAITSSSSFLI